MENTPAHAAQAGEQVHTRVHREQAAIDRCEAYRAKHGHYKPRHCTTKEA